MFSVRSRELTVLISDSILPVYVNILEAMDVFIRTFQSFTASHSGLVVDPSMNRMLAKIGLSWDQEVMDITNATKNGLLATEIQLWQWMVTAVHDIILVSTVLFMFSLGETQGVQFYVDTPDSQSEYLYNEYITSKMCRSGFCRRLLTGSLRRHLRCSGCRHWCYQRHHAFCPYPRLQSPLQ